MTANLHQKEIFITADHLSADYLLINTDSPDGDTPTPYFPVYNAR